MARLPQTAMVHQRRRPLASWQSQPQPQPWHARTRAEAGELSSAAARQTAVSAGARSLASHSLSGRSLPSAGRRCTRADASCTSAGSATGALACGVLADCGSGTQTGRPFRPLSAAPTTTTAAAVAHGSLAISRARRPPAQGSWLVFGRVVGEDPLSSELTIDRDGRATARLTLGGVEGGRACEFRLSPAQRHNLPSPRRHTRLRDTASSDARHDVEWRSLGRHAWRSEQTELPRQMRPLVVRLDHLLDAHTGPLTAAGA